MVWIIKMLDPLRISPWKTLFIDQYNTYGADKIWMLHQYVLSKVASHFNRFWTNIVQNWGKLRERCSESDNIPMNILIQSIRFNKTLKIDNIIVFCFFIINGVMQEYFFINDLLDENNEFLSFNRFQENYGIEPTFLQYMGVLHMKVRIKHTNKSQ